MREDEVDGMYEPQKKKKHKKDEQSSESAECDLMANIVEKEEIEPVLGKSIREEKGTLRMEEGQLQRERRIRKFLKIHFNIIIPSMPGSPKWSLFLSFSYQNPVYASFLPHTCYIPHPFHSRFDLNNIG
jgi:hypothetical protein